MDAGNSRMRSLLACLGDRSRFRVVASLLDREACVTELAERVGLSQSCTTRHLQALAREGIVLRARQGKRVVFRVCDDEPRVAALIEWAMLRAGAPDTVAGEIHADAMTRYLVPVRRPASRADRVRSGNSGTSATPARISEKSPTRGRSQAPAPSEPPAPSQSPAPAPAPSRTHTFPDPTDLAMEPDPLSKGSVELEATTPLHHEPAPLDRTELEDYLL